MRRRELKLRECTKDMEIIIQSLAWSVPNNFWQKEICSDSLWTNFGPSIKGPKILEYNTHIKGHHERSDLSFSRQL